MCAILSSLLSGYCIAMCSHLNERVSCLAECRCCGKAIDQILSREELVMKNYFNLLDF